MWYIMQLIFFDGMILERNKYSKKKCIVGSLRCRAVLGGEPYFIFKIKAVPPQVLGRFALGQLKPSPPRGKTAHFSGQKTAFYSGLYWPREQFMFKM